MPPGSAAETTTTTSEPVPRVTGDPLPGGVVVGLGVVLLLVILAAGWYVSRRGRAREA